MKVYQYILALLILFNISVFGQNADDALRLSSTNLSGTARYVSMGGAFGALGGDMSSISDNPASAGVFMYSEFNFSNTIQYKTNTTDFYDYSWSKTKGNLNFSNLGFIISTPIHSDTKWKNFNYAFTYNRRNNYHNKIYSSATNNYNSVSDYFAEISNGMSINDINNDRGSLAYNAYNTYVTELVPGSNNLYQSAFKNYGQKQIHEILTKGANYDLAFSIGANYDDKLYLGASINSNIERFDYKSSFSEIGNNNPNDSIKSFNYTDSYSTEGNSIAAKLGFIYKPFSWIRFGGAIHTPILYELQDDFSSQISSVIYNGSYEYAETGNQTSEYEVIVPFKAMGALAFIINKSLICSFEYQYTDMSKTRIEANGLQSAFDDVNTAISDLFKETHNLKAGLEYRLGNLSLRTGVSYFDSPFKDNHGDDNKTLIYNAGLGLNYNSFYLDLAGSYGMQKYQRYPYQLAQKRIEPYRIKERLSKFVITFGFRF